MELREMLLLAAASAAILALSRAKYEVFKARRTRKRQIWTKKWLSRRQEGRGILNMLNSELRIEDSEAYQNFLRVCGDQFDHILALIESDIKSQDTVMRESIPARSKLEVTLRFLATGESYRSLMYSTRIHESTISLFVPIVCDAIIKWLMPLYLKTPSTTAEWKKIADKYFELWQFPQCLGALDGRHITFRAPISDVSYYYNYKGTNSLVLLALADASYKFIYVNIGVNGRASDGGVFQSSNLSRAIQNNTLNFPVPENLSGRNQKVPYVIVADDAFPLLNNLLKPYPYRGLDHESKIFNYRLSRARRVIENSFGILANRFRILLNPISLSPTKVEKITLTCVISHNYLCNKKGASYTDIPNKSTHNMQRIQRQGGNKSSNLARYVRDE